MQPIIPHLPKKWRLDQGTSRISGVPRFSYSDSLSDPPAPQSFPMAGTFQDGLVQPGDISVFSCGVGRQKL